MGIEIWTTVYTEKRFTRERAWTRAGISYEVFVSRTNGGRGLNFYLQQDTSLKNDTPFFFVLLFPGTTRDFSVKFIQALKYITPAWIFFFSNLILMTGV